MTKVCILMPSHFSGRFGGAELQVQYLAEALLRIKGVHLSYIARNVDPAFEDKRYRVRRVRGGVAPGFILDAPSVLRRLTEEQPDIIYQRVGCAYTGIGALYARRNDVPLVWHVSIDSDLSPDIGRFPPLVRSLERIARDFGIRRADLIVSQTQSQADTLYSKFGKSAVVVRNFQTLPEGPFEKNERFTVVWVANLKPAKRPDLYLRIAEHFQHRNDIRFVMVGRGGDRPPYAGAIDRFRQDHGNLLDYRGELTLDQVNKILESAHVFVNTSSDEGFPNTLIQAWSRGAAVVTLGVNPDGVLTREQVGLVANGPQDAARCIEHLLAGEQGRRALNQRALAHVRQSHGPQNADKLAHLIVKCAGDHPD